ncbi:MAG: sigma-70 family RNA polymerase sigma factor [Bacteroidales bacterium]|nr:sigma-70 family RNA polymerase sigma factor [Bacteroidales bacterium]
MTLRIEGKSDRDESDLRLLDRYLKSGDLEILGVLYSEYMHLVYGVSLKYLKDRDKSQDAVIGIFEKLIVEIEKHKVENFRSWLYVMTKNWCLMELRSDKTEREKIRRMHDEETLFMENSYELHPIDKDSGIDDQVLDDCIKRLKDEQMQCIRMFYYEKRCYREIADKLRMDEKKVKSHLQNAKRNLKICLEENYGEE